MNKAAKALLALNPVGSLRAFRLGPEDAARKGFAAYDVMDPFDVPFHIFPETLDN